MDGLPILVVSTYLSNEMKGVLLDISWTGVSVRFCGFLARRDDDADFTLLRGATLPGSRKSVQSRP